MQCPDSLLIKFPVLAWFGLAWLGMVWAGGLIWLDMVVCFGSVRFGRYSVEQPLGYEVAYGSSQSLEIEYHEIIYTDSSTSRQSRDN